ncbi:MAG: ABC transporter ATP-binding protein [Symbiobacteriia bacterium]
MAGVKLNQVGKRYGEVVAVSDVNLEVADQEFLVLVGPSGCGKSTTLRMIAGLEEISEGSIYIGDRLVNDVAPKDRDIAMVFQNYALYPHMNVYENMAFGLKLRKFSKPEIDRRVREAAQILGIEELLKRRPKELSGGQRQRVALGRAIVREPAVFLMDEPLSNLDAKLRVQMRTEIAKLHKRLQTTIIYVTHDQTEAMTMGDRIVVMKDGFMQQVASPQEIYDRPANIFVAGFIGSPPMNLLRVKLAGGRLTAAGLDLPVPADRAEVLKAYEGREVVLGIRPEDVSDRPADLERAAAGNSGGTGGAVFECQVEVMEPLGSEVYLHLTLGEQRLTARVAPDTKIRDGEKAKLALNLAKIHLFDADTELAISGSHP